MFLNWYCCNLTIFTHCSTLNDTIKQKKTFRRKHSRIDQVKFVEDSLQKILLGPFSNTLSHLKRVYYRSVPHFKQHRNKNYLKWGFLNSISFLDFGLDGLWMGWLLSHLSCVEVYQMAFDGWKQIKCKILTWNLFTVLWKPPFFARHL